MTFRIGIALVFCLVLFSGRTARAHEGGENHDGKEGINGIMTEKLSKIDQVFADFDKTKLPKELSKIKKLNDGAGVDLFKWWDSVTAPCCLIRKEGQDPRAAYKEAVEKNEPVLTRHLNTLCNNYTKIAGSYLQVKKKKEARRIYQLVLDSYEPSKYDACVKEAENGLRNL